MLLYKICVACLLSVLLAISHVQGMRQLKILGLFPHPGASHFDFFQPIMLGLAEAGHDVSVISHFPEKSPPIRYKDFPLTGSTLQNSIDLKVFEKRYFFNHFVEFFLLHDWGKQACNLTLRSDALAQVLRRKPGYYDLIIVEQFNTDCMMGVAHQLRAPVIALSSCAMMPWHYERMGAPIIPSHIPALFLGQSEAMTFAGRVANWISFHGLNLLYKFLSIPATDALVRHKFGQEVPSVGELVKNTSLFFVNQHYALSGVKPLPPNIIQLGGIHIRKAKPLPADLQRLLDNAEHGVVLISWGSMIRAASLPAEKRDGILRAITRLKQRVIWKWENDTLTNKPENLFVSPWLPQRDILCHPNVKVFLTHGGLMGSSEAAYCGVPVVATPMYGDQFLNTAAMMHRGMGVELRYEDINENTVIRAIKKAMDKKYVDNAKAVSYTYNHRPATALQSALWWIEYVAHTQGAPLLQSSAAHMSRFSYYSLDVYLLFIAVLAIVISSWLFIIRRLCGKQPVAAKKTKEH